MSADAAQLEHFRALVGGRLGLQFDTNRRDVLATVLHRRLEEAGADAEAYLARLRAPHGARREWRVLARELTVGETYFFRHAEQMRAFAEGALPERLAVPGRPLRILSAGCASGEETYSLAMLTRDAPGLAGREVSIRGIDVNSAMLARAMQGRCAPWSLRETPPALKARFFRQAGREFVIDAGICAMAAFEERNLVADDPAFWQPDMFDIVFCRNVIMYFAPAVAEAVIARIARSLAPGWYLFLGHAESLRGVSQDFDLCQTHGAFYYRRRATLADRHGAAATRHLPLPPAAIGDTGWMDAIRRAALRIEALAASAPPPHATVRDATPAGKTCAEWQEHDDAGAHYLAALCREHAGDTDGAVAHDRIAARLDPGFAMPRLHLGLLARRGGAPDAAREEFARALLLLEREESARLRLFGGGFGREALVALCRAELAACRSGA